MWPWGHAAVGYLLYTGWSRLRYRKPPVAIATLALAIGTQFPDLVDKPLAWELGLLASGRGGAHSLLVAVPILLVLWWILDSPNGRVAWGGFAVGYLSHLAADGIHAALRGEFAELSYLLWPVTPIPDYSESQSILAHFAAMEFTPSLYVQFGLFGLVTLLWLVDGAPGIRLMIEWVKRQATTAKAALSKQS